MNITDTYNSIKDLIDEKLNDNDNGIIFDTTLFNSQKISYTNTVNVSGTDRTEDKQVVPAHIVEINSRYINIPQTDALEAGISMEFDVFVRDSNTLNNAQDQEKYESVSYNNTIIAINNLQKELLAESFTLGDSGLYFGGEDSEGEVILSSAVAFNTIYLKVDIKNLDTENLFTCSNGGFEISINKTATSIQLYWNTPTGGDYLLGINYEEGINEIVAYYDENDFWNLVVNGVATQQQDTATQGTFDTFYISPTSKPYGFDGILYQLIIDDKQITSNDTNDVETSVSPANVNFKDFDDRYSFNQTGTYVLSSNQVDNCILTGSDGNITFGFEGLIPIGDMFYNDEGYPRQMFFLSIPCLISDDLLFGNSTEYYLDGNRIYPVDRNTTYGTEQNTAQYINATTAKSVAEENARDLENSFFYKPSRQINQLFKHIVSNSTEQNKVYQLVVQYPFWRETYDVIIDSGGTSTNLNQFHTFTLTYKNKDDNLS